MHPTRITIVVALLPGTGNTSTNRLTSIQRSNLLSQKSRLPGTGNTSTNRLTSTPGSRVTTVLEMDGRQILIQATKSCSKLGLN
jgi:hypothetical protein